MIGSDSIRRRPRHRRLGRRNREGGFTLVELMVALTIFALLLGSTMVILSTVYQATSHINVTYTNVDEQLLLATNLQRLVRSAVAPAPSTSGSTPIPAFGYSGTTAPTPTSMIFYTNLGTKTGPVKVKAWCTATPTNSTLCEKRTSTTGKNQASLTVAVAHPTATCPTSTTSITHCKYPMTGTHVVYKTLFTVPHLVNGTNKTLLFVYSWHTATTINTVTVHAVCSGKITTTPATKCSTLDHTTFSTCAKPTAGKPTFSKCKAGDIDSVTYDVQINLKSTPLHGGSQAEDDTGIFTLSSTSVLFNPTVG